MPDLAEAAMIDGACIILNLNCALVVETLWQSIPPFESALNGYLLQFVHKTRLNTRYLSSVQLNEIALRF